MKYNPVIHNRRSVRLKGYDYSLQGAYFITICCNNRTCLFGEITNGEMILNPYGKIAYNEWLKTTEIRSNVELDVFIPMAIGMPNHIHGIIIINNERRGVLHTPCLNNVYMSELQKPHVLHTSVVNNLYSSVPDPGVCNTPLQKTIDCEFWSPSNNIGAIVRGYKSAVTKQINILDSGRYNRSSIVWQRSFYEHIIRNEKSYQNISDYIVNNPSKWNTDAFHKT